MREILCYELSTVPYALAHNDGTLKKTTKILLLQTLSSVHVTSFSLVYLTVVFFFMDENVLFVRFGIASQKLTVLVLNRCSRKLLTCQQPFSFIGGQNNTIWSFINPEFKKVIIFWTSFSSRSILLRAASMWVPIRSGSSLPHIRLTVEVIDHAYILVPKRKQWRSSSFLFSKGFK